MPVLLHWPVVLGCEPGQSWSTGSPSSRNALNRDCPPVNSPTNPIQSPSNPAPGLILHHSPSFPERSNTITILGPLYPSTPHTSPSIEKKTQPHCSSPADFPSDSPLLQTLKAPCSLSENYTQESPLAPRLLAVSRACVHFCRVAFTF